MLVYCGHLNAYIVVLIIVYCVEGISVNIDTKTNVIGEIMKTQMIIKLRGSFELTKSSICV